MSLLLAGIPRATGEALINRLLAEGDEVRIIEQDPALAEGWAALGAHVARGPASDADLIERAAHHVRSVVVMDRAAESLHDVVSAVVEGARLATPGIRVIVCATQLDPDSVAAVKGSGLEHVLLRTGSRRGLVPFERNRIPAAKVVEAIDAADDLGAEVRLDLDLTDPTAWSTLGLDAP